MERADKIMRWRLLKSATERKKEIKKERSFFFFGGWYTIQLASPLSVRLYCTITLTWKSPTSLTLREIRLIQPKKRNFQSQIRYAAIYKMLISQVKSSQRYPKPRLSLSRCNLPHSQTSTITRRSIQLWAIGDMWIYLPSIHPSIHPSIRSIPQLDPAARKKRCTSTGTDTGTGTGIGRLLYLSISHFERGEGRGGDKVLVNKSGGGDLPEYSLLVI